MQKGHECKATQRVSGPVRLRFGPCRSKKRYRPKFCGSCDDKVGDGCCTPQLSTTIKVSMRGEKLSRLNVVVIGIGATRTTASTEDEPYSPKTTENFLR